MKLRSIFLVLTLASSVARAETPVYPALTDINASYDEVVGMLNNWVADVVISEGELRTGKHTVTADGNCLEKVKGDVLRSCDITIAANSISAKQGLQKYEIITFRVSEIARGAATAKLFIKGTTNINDGPEVAYRAEHCTIDTSVNFGCFLSHGQVKYGEFSIFFQDIADRDVSHNFFISYSRNGGVSKWVVNTTMMGAVVEGIFVDSDYRVQLTVN